MKPRFYLLFTALLILCATVLLGQKAHNGNLKKKLTEAKQLRRTANGNQPQTTLATTQAISKNAGKIEIQNYRERTTPKQRIEKTLTQIQALQKNWDESNPASFLIIVKETVAIIQPLNGEELFALIDELSSKVTDQTSLSPSPADAFYNSVLTFLQPVASEVDPTTALQRMATGDTDPHILLVGFGAIARHDPEAAALWIEQSGPSTLRTLFEKSLLHSVLENDPKSAPATIRRFNLGNEEMTLPPETVAALRSTYHDPENSDLRKDLGRIMIHSQLEQNVSEAKNEAEVLALSPAELDRILVGSTLSDSSEQRQLMDWIQQIAATSETPASLHSLKLQTSHWATMDLEASADWIASLETAPIKDEAIHGFSTAVQELDPEAATLWADQIENSTLRQRVLRDTLQKWEQQDATAAAQWKKENDL